MALIIVRRCGSARTCRWPAACRRPSNARSCTAARRCRSSARTPTSGRASRSIRPRSARSAHASTRPASRPVVAHASYLINLATTFPLLREQSIAAFIDELDRAEALGLLGVVIHPGTCTAGSEDDALRLIAEAIRAAFTARPRRQTMVLLEHTAGQGRTVGHRFEHLAAILEHLDGSPRVGVCLDTCHLVASGYDIVSEQGYRETLRRLRSTSSASIASRCFTATIRRSRAAAASIGTSTSAKGASASNRSAGCSTTRASPDLPILIETEKTSRVRQADDRSRPIRST